MHDQSFMMGLLVACPVTQRNPDDCPLHEVRQRPMRERFEWLKQLSADECGALIGRHLACHRVRGRGD
jgi:hypothetical protein